MRNFIEIKIRAKGGWLNSGVFEVVRMVYKPGKPVELIREKTLFEGNIVSCKAFLDLFNDGHITNDQI